MPLTHNLFTTLGTVPFTTRFTHGCPGETTFPMNLTTFSYYCFQNTSLQASWNVHFCLLTGSEGSDTLVQKACLISLTACYAHLRPWKHSFHVGNRFPNSENESAVHQENAALTFPMKEGWLRQQLFLPLISQEPPWKCHRDEQHNKVRMRFGSDLAPWISMSQNTNPTECCPTPNTAFNERPHRGPWSLDPLRELRKLTHSAGLGHPNTNYCRRMVMLGKETSFIVGCIWGVSTVYGALPTIKTSSAFLRPISSEGPHGCVYYVQVTGGEVTRRIRGFPKQDTSKQRCVCLIYLLNCPHTMGSVKRYRGWWYILMLIQVRDCVWRNMV